MNMGSLRRFDTEPINIVQTGLESQALGGHLGMNHPITNHYSEQNNDSQKWLLNHPSEEPTGNFVILRTRNPLSLQDSCSCWVHTSTLYLSPPLDHHKLPRNRRLRHYSTIFVSRQQTKSTHYWIFEWRWVRSCFKKSGRPEQSLKGSWKSEKCVKWIRHNSIRTSARFYI